MAKQLVDGARSVTRPRSVVIPAPFTATGQVVWVPSGTAGTWRLSLSGNGKRRRDRAGDVSSSRPGRRAAGEGIAPGQPQRGALDRHALHVAHGALGRSVELMCSRTSFDGRLCAPASIGFIRT
ncbi:MAG: hypothetical protein R2708_26790 [Vicinamibacterales bacterium]